MTNNNCSNNDKERGLISFEAAFDDATMENIEKNIQDNSKDDAVNRRVALVILTRSSPQLISSLSDDESIDALLEAVECLGKTIDAEKNKLEMLESAQARMFAVLSKVVGIDLKEALPN